MVQSIIIPLIKLIKTSMFYGLILISIDLCSMSMLRSTDNQRVYGIIASEKKQMENGTTRERVIIYPQEYHNSDNTIMRNGLLVRHKDAKATILVCHGFMCDLHDAGMLRGMFKKSQCNVMTFDFRGHGKDNEGQYCTFGRDEALDVIAAAKFIKNHPELKDLPLFAYGFSMGAVSAIEAQSVDATLFDAMILDCPFESSEKVIKTGLEGLKFSLLGYEFEFPGKNLLERYAFHPYVQSLVKTVLRIVSQMDATRMRTNFCPVHPVESIKKVTVPCFFIHCKNDEKVGTDQVKAIYEGAAGYKKLWLTNGRRHCDSAIYNPERYAEEVRLFCNAMIELLNGDIDELPQGDIVEDGEDDDSYAFS